MKASDYSIKIATESLYRSENDSVYRIDFSGSNRILKMAMVDREVGAEDSVETKWSSYVENFVRADGDPDAIPSKCPLFLRRSMLLHGNDDARRKSLMYTAVIYNLECKICINTYKMFFVENSEDLVHRRFHADHQSSLHLNGRLEKRFKSAKHRFNLWLVNRQENAMLE